MVERLRSQVKNMEDSKRSFVKEETSWNWEEYLKEIGWFARICNLPDKGLIPSEISSNLVTPLMLQECFGKRGNSGYKLTNCMIIPQAEIKALLQAVNGHQSSPFNNLLSTTTANGIYADRILNLKVNWAAYAHTKHKNQLQLAWKRGRPAPDAPPLLRHPVRYEPPPPLNVKANQRRGPVEAPLESPFTNAGANPFQFGLWIAVLTVAVVVLKLEFLFVRKFEKTGTELVHFSWFEMSLKNFLAVHAADVKC